MRAKILILLLVLGTVMLYWPVRHFDFIFYDDPNFVANPGIQAGLSWQTFKWAMTDIVFADWHPATILSFLLTHQIFGTNQGAEHLVNVEFHAANAVLLFLLLLRLTGATWRSAAVAAIFAWHPQRVESVCWIAERKDVLFAFFMLLSLLCYVEYVRRRMDDQARAGEISKPDLYLWNLPYLFSLAFFILSFLSKGMVATLPFLLLLLDFWPLQRLNRATIGRVIIEKIPFFALTIFLSALTFWIHKKHGDYKPLEELGTVWRFENAIWSYLEYLAQFFWPSNLAIIYPYPKSFDPVQVSLAGLLLLAISALCVLELSRRPYLAVGWFWYLGTMLPVIGLVQFGQSPMADRYTYVPLIGLLISLVWLVSDWVGTNLSRKYLATSMATAILAVCLILTRTQIMYWQNTVTVFQHAVNVTSDNTYAQYLLGIGLGNEGKFRQAAVHVRIALALKPRASGYEYLAELLAKLGQYHEAVSDFEKALQPNPDRIDTLKSFAWLLATCPDASIRDGPRAVQLARHACELTHYQQAALVGTLAAACAEAGQFDDAVTTANEAIKLAREYDQTTMLQQNQWLLKFYVAHKAYREQPGNELPGGS